MVLVTQKRINLKLAKNLPINNYPRILRNVPLKVISLNQGRSIQQPVTPNDVSYSYGSSKQYSLSNQRHLRLNQSEYLKE